MDRYEEVILERKDNKYGTVKISVLAQMEIFCEARANKRCEIDL
jgi:hypothetical protein